MAITNAVSAIIFDLSIFWNWFADMGDPHANRTRLLSGLVEITHPGAVPGQDAYTYLWGSGFGYDANTNTYSGTIDYFARVQQPNNTLPGFDEVIRTESATSLNIGLNDFMFAVTPEARFDLVFSGNDTLNWNGKEVIGGFEGGAGADTFNGSGRTDDQVSFREQAGEGVLIDLATPSLNTNDAAGDTYNSIDEFSLSGFNDVAYGDSGNNNFNGNGGSDYIDGRDGDDTIVGGQSFFFGAPDGVDTLYGGAGNDLILGGAGNDYIQGGAGNDELNGTSFGNVYEGGDILSLADATSSVMLSLGVFGDGTVTADGTGTDTFTHFDHVEGGAASDDISGNHRNNILWGFGGVDTLRGTGGNDTLYGGNDGDFLFGGNDDDTLVGEGGIDELYGEAGNDRFIFGAADANFLGVSDLIRGGTHTTRDIIEVQAPVIPGPAEPYESEFIDLRNFNIDEVEALQITSGQAVVRSWHLNHVQYNTFTGSSLTATGRIGTIIGGNGANMLTLTAQIADYNPGNIEVSFAPLQFESWNAAEDLVFITSENGMRTVIGTNQRDYMVGAIAGGNFGTILAGGDGDDTIVGSSVNDLHYNGISGGLDGGNGNDTIFGGGGNDGIDGGAGNDQLFGDAGNDVFLYFGSSANNFDVYNGGTETDTAFFGYFGSAIFVDLSGSGDQLVRTTNTSSARIFDNPNVSVARIVSIEVIVGSEFIDEFIGNSATSDTFRGGSGNDQFNSSFTSAVGTVDLFDGDGGTEDVASFLSFNSAIWVNMESAIEVRTSDTSNATSSNANRTIADLSEIEIVFGTAFADRMQGNAAQNIFNGYQGNDTFVMSASQNSGAIDQYLGDVSGSTAGIDTADFSAFGSGVWVNLGFSGTRSWTSNTSVATAVNATIRLAELFGIESITGTAGTDHITGDNAANTYGFTGMAAGSFDLFDGRGGTDTADFTRYGSAVFVDLASAGVEARTSLTLAATALNSTTNALDLIAVENVTGSVFADTLMGDASTNLLDGGAGNDTLAMSTAIAFRSIDTFNGGTSGIDTADFSAFGSAVWVSLGFNGVETWTSNSSVATTASATTKLAELISVENIIGTIGTDHILGNANENTYGFTGMAAKSFDYFDGKGGSDTADFSGFGSAIWVSLGLANVEAWTSNTGVATTANATTRAIDLLAVENIIGTAGTDYILGDALANSYGFTGMNAGTFDFFDGKGATDAADFSRFSSAIWCNLDNTNVEAWTSNTAVATGANANTRALDVLAVENITGTAFSDYLRGANGVSNALTGGLGADTFAFGNTWGSDTVTDFQDTIDRIDLTAVAGLTTFSQLSVSGIANGTATVTFGGQTITLNNLSLGAVLDNADFIV